MFSLLLGIIYLSFISLGLPDALLGSAWPIMHQDLHVSLSYSGSIYMTISFCTILSSLRSESLNIRFGTGKITTFSVLLTALALLGFSYSHSYYALLLFAVPYGLGAGSVDAALNHYVALHYSGRQMNWLHCMWGIGASLGPYIMGFVLQRGSTWRTGYFTVFILQALLTTVLVFSLGLWKQGEKTIEKTEKIEGEKKKAATFREIFAISGAKECLAAFFFYCAIEQTIGLWAGSFMVYSLKIDAKLAASLVALFYFGITFGRFLSGIFSARLKDEELIQAGFCILFFALLLLFISFLVPEGMPLFGTTGRVVLIVFSLLFLGLGCAPIYPAVIHSTPYNFGAENTSALIGKQMAAAYIGSLSLPPIFGLIAKQVGTSLFPLYALLLFLAMVYFYKSLLRKTRRAKAERR
nr:MFS transporter [uncultured Oribacterium sp.]